MVVTHTEWHQNMPIVAMLAVNMDMMTTIVSGMVMRMSMSMEQNGTHIAGSKDIKDGQ